MGFFVSGFRLGTLRAVVRFRLPKTGVDAVTVECDGEQEWIPHLPGSTFDRFLAKLSNSKDERRDLLLRFGVFVNEAMETLASEKTALTAQSRFHPSETVRPRGRRNQTA